MTAQPRPLIVTDCDEVLLHMVVPFREWLDSEHDVHFSLGDPNFVNSLRRKACGTVLEQGEVWDLLRRFFLTEMHRQYPISGALEALDRLSGLADIVVLTNIGEEAHQLRIEQLRAVGVHAPVFWNQGPKGPPIRQLIAERTPGMTLFIDDLAIHHASVAREAPDVWRLHMVGEPEIAGIIPPAPEAHARIDSWAEAERWIHDRLADARPAPAPEALHPA